MRRFLGLFLLLWGLLLVSCNEDNVQNVYSKYKAFFRYDNVITTFPLKAALATGSGIYCAVYPNGGGQIIFQAPNLDALKVNISALAYYQDYINPTGSGFIIGSSNVPEAPDNTLPILCFDRGCPNCYEDNGISKPLTISETGTASCSRCNRVYDLNNCGIISSGNDGIKLYRYRITYDGANSMVINNR